MHRLIGNTNLGPSEIQLAGQAFDEAWSEIAADVGSDPLVVQAMRLQLAGVILKLYHEGITHAEALTKNAIERVR